MTNSQSAHQHSIADSHSRLPKSRWGAFTGHLLISVLIFALLCGLIYFLLFPGALFSAAGGIDGIKIVAGVDLVLGPLLTLVIYNFAKPRKELMRDLTIIGLIQFFALAAGMYVVYQNRPAIVNYALDTFHVLKLSQFEQAGQPLPDHIKLLSPTYYVLDLPVSKSDAAQTLLAMELGGEPPATATRLYRPMSELPDTLKTQLRIDRETYLDGDCITREVSTAYELTELCFDFDKRRFRPAN